MGMVGVWVVMRVALWVLGIRLSSSRSSSGRKIGEVESRPVLNDTDVPLGRPDLEEMASK